MDLSRFREFYERIGFWNFWWGILALATMAYVIFQVFAYVVGPYVVGMWLAWEMSR